MKTTNQLTGTVIDAALKVHTALGPGLLESAYEACLAYELIQRGLKVERQKELPVLYEGVRIDCGYRLDLLVENDLIVELKAVEAVAPIHHAQLLSYLRLANKPVGLLINFHEEHLKDGIIRKAESARHAKQINSAVKKTMNHGGTQRYTETVVGGTPAAYNSQMSSSSVYSASSAVKPSSPSSSSA